MSKIFISFLGTSNYLTCNYTFDDLKIPEVRFIQEACIQAHCLDYDKFLFFNTQKAHSLNWSSEESHRFNPEKKLSDPDNSGLKARLSKIDRIKDKFQEIIIPEGFSEKEVWDIFDLIYNNIDQDAEIVLDITHAFRSIPMIGMALINYLKVTKNISVNGIYYGAFEKLNADNAVGEMDLCDRNVDVIDLSSLSALQDWTIATHNFSKFGNPNDLIDLVKKNINPILAQTQGQDEMSKLLRDAIFKLEEVYSNVSTSRGIPVYHSEYIDKIISACSALKVQAKPQIRPLIEILEKRVSNLKKDDILNGFEVVKWCLDFGWLPQAATFLQETLISYFMNKHSDIITEVYGEEKESLLTNFNLRMEVNKALNINIDSTVADNSKANKLADLIKKDEGIAKWCSIARELTDMRNDINHCGHRDNWRSTNTIKDNLKKIYDQIMEGISNE